MSLGAGLKFNTDRGIGLPPVSDISDRFFLFLAGSALMLGASLWAPVRLAGEVFLGAGAGLFLLAVIGLAVLIRRRLDGWVAKLSAGRALRVAVCPTVATDGTGRIRSVNGAARRAGLAGGGAVLGDVSEDAFGVAKGTLGWLQARAEAQGATRQELSLADGPVWVHVDRVSDDRFLWRFDRRQTSQVADLDNGDCVALIQVAPDGQVLSGNPQAERLLGRVPERLAELANGRCKTGVPVSVEGADGPVTVNLVEIRASGGVREIALLPVADNLAGPVHEILSEPGLLDALPVPMLKIGASGALLEANGEARTILSLGAGPLPPLYELVEGMGRPIADWLADAAKGRGLLRPEIVRAVIPDQELFLQITLGRAVEGGEPVLIAILNDATELKTLEAQFVQSQKMQAIGQLAGGVAHDFNNLLTAIGGHCDLLLLRHDTGDPDYADLIQISQNANRAASLVGQLLAFSRKQNLKPQALDLRDTMSDLAHLLNRLIGEKIALDVIHAPGDQVIRADRRQMEQVIINLVVNARDAMPEGGRIAISIRRDCLDAPQERDRARLEAGDYVVIEVKDTGIGIPPDAIRKIFEPFYTTKKTGEGTGLGLSTAYGIVKQTGGFIFVDSAPGEGTLFSLYFPALDSAEEVMSEDIPTDAPSVPTQSGGVVLLVEDEAPVRAFAGRALKMRGYTVLEAANAEEALDILKDGALNVDVFVTDVIMPGLDGPSWVRQALRDRPKTKTVFVSGYSEEGRVEKQARIPNSVFLPKPFSLRQLTDVVNSQFA